MEIWSTQVAEEKKTNIDPGERATKQVLERQADFIAKEPVMAFVINAMPEIVVVTNKQRQVVFANDALYKFIDTADPSLIVGLRPGEALGCAHAVGSEGGCGTTEFCEACGAAQTFLAGLNGISSTNECLITRADGGEALDLRIWGTPFVSGGEEFTFAIIKDISHEKRRKVLERIFFHDIMNTAGALRGFAEVLTLVPPEKIDGIRQNIFNLAETLIEEIAAQRDIHAAENHELSPEFEPVQGLPLLHEVACQYSNIEISKEKSIAVDEGAEDAMIDTDVTLLRRVIGNMVKNALEAAGPGETITLGSRKTEKGLDIWVHNPNFIPDSIRRLIFKRSFSTKGKSRGLGTYSIKLLTESYLRGSVWMETDEKEGSTFTIQVPFVS